MHGIDFGAYNSCRNYKELPLCVNRFHEVVSVFLLIELTPLIMGRRKLQTRIFRTAVLIVMLPCRFSTRLPAK